MAQEESLYGEMEYNNVPMLGYMSEIKSLHSNNVVLELLYFRVRAFSLLSLQLQGGPKCKPACNNLPWLYGAYCQPTVITFGTYCTCYGKVTTEGCIVSAPNTVTRSM